MQIMKKIITVLTLLFSINGFTATDYTCVSDCTSKGYMYNLCTEKCSFGENSSHQELDASIIWKQKDFESPKRTDPKCLKECTSEGYMYGFCKNRCSY